MARIKLATIRNPKTKSQNSVNQNHGSQAEPPKISPQSNPLGFLNLPPSLGQPAPHTREAASLANKPADGLPSVKEVNARMAAATRGADTKPAVSPADEAKLAKEHHKNVVLANTYLGEFPQKLQKYQARKPDKMKPEELLSFIETLRFEVSTSTGDLTRYINSVAKPMLAMYEKILVQSAGLKVTGLSAVADTQDFQETTKALVLKYFGNSLVAQTEPEMKLIWMIASATFAAHYAGEAGTAARSQLTGPAPPSQASQPVVRPANTVEEQSSGGFQMLRFDDLPPVIALAEPVTNPAPNPVSVPVATKNIELSEDKLAKLNEQFSDL